MVRTNTKARKVLQHYALCNIDTYITITAALTIISYALYTVEPETVIRFGSNAPVYTIILVVYGVFRYLYILDKTAPLEDPTENLLKDKGLLGVCFIYVIYLLIAFYFFKGM